jgi:hypothetical protein
MNLTSMHSRSTKTVKHPLTFLFIHNVPTYRLLLFCHAAYRSSQLKFYPYRYSRVAGVCSVPAIRAGLQLTENPYTT